MKEVLAKAESKMGKTIARLESDYAAIRAGRANPAVLDKVMGDYYGAPAVRRQDHPPHFPAAHRREA